MRHAISTRAACLLLAATLATPGRTARAQTGPPPPTPNYSSQLAAAVGPSGELGVSSEYAFNLFGLSLLGVLFGSIANPPRDRNGDVVNVPPTTVPPHLTGQKLGAAAAQAPAVRGAFPAARAGPPPPDSLEPSVSHTLDPPLATGSALAHRLEPIPSNSSRAVALLRFRRPYKQGSRFLRRTKAIRLIPRPAR